MRNLITLLLTIIVSTTLFSQEIKFGKVSKEELEEKFYPKDSTANAAYLYRYRRTYYEHDKNDGFKVITEVTERIKIYNKEGVKYGNIMIGFYKPDNGSDEKVTGIKGYSFNLNNGAIEKEKLKKSQIFDDKTSKYTTYKKIAMPNVKEGTVIDLKYRITSPYSRDIKNVKFQFAIPVKTLKARIEIPEYYGFKKEAKGYYSVPLHKSRKNGKLDYAYSERGAYNKESKYKGSIDYIVDIDEYKATNIPSLKDNEPYVSNIKNYRGGIQYELSFTKMPNSIPKYYSTTWEDVSKKIHNYKNFGNELKKQIILKMTWQI